MKQNNLERQQPGRKSTGQSSLHFGVISEVYPNGTARVTLPDMDGLTTMPIPVIHQNSDTRIWYWMPEAGQRVACLLDEAGEQGCILGGVYTEANPPPIADLDKFYFKFAGIEVLGDRVSGDVVIQTTGNLTLIAQRIDFNP